MIVVMGKETSAAEIDNVCARIQSHGLRVHMSPGSERTVLGVLGPTFPELKDELDRLPGVADIIAISKPYKLSGRELKKEDSLVRIGDVVIGGSELVVMAGPCSVEDEEQVVSTALAVKAAGATVFRGGAFKPRTSPYSFRGMGVDGLRLLAKAREATGLPIITEVVTPEDVETVAYYADILQVGTRNMQNYNLLERVASCGKPVLLKRAFSATYEEWLLAAEYILSGGNDQVILCERGIRTFETSTRFTVDISAIPAIKRLSHLPVIVDPSHGTGKWYLVAPMALASVAAGAHGLMIEVHPNPDLAKCDGPESLTFENFHGLMDQVRAVARAVGKVPAGSHI
jgi:3-deoxy-7-phosphoheptulonate synthase